MSRLAIRRAPLHDVDQLLPVRKMGAEHEMVVAAREELEHPRVAADHDRPPVGVSVDVLDAGDRPGGEVRDHPRPVERPVERQMERKTAVRREAVRGPSPAPEHPRRHPKDVAARAIELADAPEARREGHLDNGEVGVVEQAAGEVRPGRARQAVRRHVHVGCEEPAQVPRRHVQARAELGLRATVESAVEDEPHRPADQLRAVPGEGLWRPVRPAAKAGPIAGRLGGGREGELGHVLRPRAGRATRPAVDTCRNDRGERFHAVRYTAPESS
jgi:hypothetical protein